MNPKKPRRWRPLLPTLLVAILVTTASMPSAAERTLVEPAPGPSLATPVNPALDHQRDLRVDDHAAPRVDNHVDLPFDRPLDRPLDLPFDRPLDSQLAQLADPMRGRTPVADESVPRRCTRSRTRICAASAPIRCSRRPFRTRSTATR